MIDNRTRGNRSSILHPLLRRRTERKPITGGNFLSAKATFSQIISALYADGKKKLKRTRCPLSIRLQVSELRTVGSAYRAELPIQLK